MEEKHSQGIHDHVKYSSVYLCCGKTPLGKQHGGSCEERVIEMHIVTYAWRVTL